MTDATIGSTIDNAVGALEQALASILGITIDVDVATALLTLTTPPGVIQTYAGSTAPTGWLLCDGAAVSRTTFAVLFAICGTTYGAGDGSTTFNLPNLKGRMPVGIDAAQPEFDVRGETGGAKILQNHVHDMAAHTHGMQSHTHTIAHGHTGSSFTGNALGGHQHRLPFITNAGVGLGAAFDFGWAASTTAGVIIATGAPSATVNYLLDEPLSAGTPTGSVAIAGADVGSSGGPSTANTAGPSAANTGNPTTTPTSMPPYVALHYIIRTGNLS